MRAVYVAYVEYIGEHILCCGSNKAKVQRRGLAIANEKHRRLGIVKRELVHLDYKRYDIRIKQVELVS
jgi:hypothetical protein